MYVIPISIHDQQRYNHHLSHEIFKGPIPEGGVVRHSCDNRRCWNPAHLAAGSQQENVDDMWDRGRAFSFPPRHGLANNKATLTPAQVEQIRRRGITNQRETAAEFGVSQSTVWRIVHQQTRTVA